MLILLRYWYHFQDLFNIYWCTNTLGITWSLWCTKSRMRRKKNNWRKEKVRSNFNTKFYKTTNWESNLCYIWNPKYLSIRIMHKLDEHCYRIHKKCKKSAHTYIYIYVYKYIRICMYVCICNMYGHCFYDIYLLLPMLKNRIIIHV